MHLRQVHIKNVRSIDELLWQLPDDVEGPGWHVILGDNGSGKSTFLRAIALALIGPGQAPALRQSWKGWLRHGATEAVVDMDLHPSTKGSAGSGRPVGVRLTLDTSQSDPDVRATEESVSIAFSPRSEEYSRTRNSGNVWGAGVFGGWFSASYGPFRRFTGGDPAQEDLFTTNPKLARHLSVFGEAVALTEVLRWLQALRFKQLEDPDGAESKLLGLVVALINQPGFLPNGAQLGEVSSKGVSFVDGNGAEVLIQELSDGYRSILSMTLDLIRQMSIWMGEHVLLLFSEDGRVVNGAGTVLIDEIDAHLHPTWQRTVGGWFRRYFPNVQFIVTTHSPLICQACEGGSVFVLPRPGTDERGEMVREPALSRLLYGDVLDAYSTGVFGDGVTRSVAAQEKLKRLASLNRSEAQRLLTEEERSERDELREIMATSAAAVSAP
jgi:energy-coupling factor transporter ATP-binding protein EcfA2